jgi:hypothetical protein
MTEIRRGGVNEEWAHPGIVGADDFVFITI